MQKNTHMWPGTLARLHFSTVEKNFSSYAIIFLIISSLQQILLCLLFPDHFSRTVGD